MSVQAVTSAGTISLSAIDATTTNRLKPETNNVRADEPSQQRILWMATFVPGLEGRRGLPYVLVGEPGTVKTSIVKWLARKASLPCWSILGSIRSPLDFMGCPVPQRMKLSPNDQHLAPDGEPDFLYTHYAPAGFGVKAALAQNGVLLFDEANNMPPAVQSAMLRVLFEGVMGELEFPPGIRMFLATNDLQDAASGWDISTSMANRMGWLTWEGSTVEKFNAYAVASGGRGSQAVKVDAIDWRVEEQKVDALWDEAWTKTCMLVGGFLTARPGHLQNKPKVKSKDNKAWPSSRTWEFAMHALAGTFVYNMSQIEREMAVSAYVSSSVYKEFYAYAKEADLPDPGLLLDGQQSFTHNPQRLDRTAAVLAGCTSTVLPESSPNRHARTAALWRLFKNVPDSMTDVATPHVLAVASKDLMLGHPEAYQVFAKHDAIVNAVP